MLKKYCPAEKYRQDIQIQGCMYNFGGQLKGNKGLAKLGNIVAETLLRMQMFPSLAARETCVAETNFAARSQKHFCFSDTNFASETYVSQFSHTGKHNKKHCFRNNVSKFSQALMESE